MNIDVVIPTCNNIDSKHFSLYFTVRSLLAQSLQPKKIIVAENGNFEQTKTHMEKEFGNLIFVIDATEKSRNISFARNKGSQMGNSEIILFIDDDVIIGKNEFLEKITHRMKTLDFYCAAKRYWAGVDWKTFLNKSFLVNHIQHILYHKSYLPKSIDRFSGKQSFHEFSHIGHFGAINRIVFEKNNGFDENYREWSYQDTDLMMRLSVGNYVYQLMYHDDIFIYHLAHSVDKSKYEGINKALYEKKQKELGIKFHLNHFFGIFDDDQYAIWS